MTPTPVSTLTEVSAPPQASPARRLRQLALLDTNVVVISVVLANLLRAFSSVVLTRLLVPEVFGIAGVIASIIFLGEKPTPNDMIGFVLIFCAAACVLLRPTAKPIEMPE